MAEQPPIVRYHEPSRFASARQARQSERQLTAIEDATMARIAKVRAESLVAKEKMRGADYLAREAMVGQTMLRQWAHILSHGDPILADELDMFPAIARTSKVQVLTDFARDAFES